MIEFKIWDHQSRAVSLANKKDSYALFFEQGTGKTLTAIQILRNKCIKENRLLRTLILCPLIVLKNWKKEFEMFSNIKDVTILDGSQKNRIENFHKNAVTNYDTNSLSRSYKPHIFITNHEALAVLKDLVYEFMLWRPEVLIVDESQKFKDGSAKRTKAAIKLADLADFRYILTGTPILNDPMDIFSQYRILDGGKTFGKNFMFFRAEYFYDKNASMPKQNYFPNWQVRPGSLEKMNQKIYGEKNEKAMRVTKEECLDLPDEVEQIIEVDMTPQQRKMYNEMADDFITYVNSDACVANLALTKALRLQQITSGFVKLETGREAKIADTPRQEILSELLEILTPNSKVIVWAVFKENYEQIKKVCESLKIKYVECHGEIPNKQKFENVEAFNSDPEVRVFIGNPGAAGIGINLVVSNYSIFFSRTFSLEQYLQARARNHRAGQTQKVTHYHLVTPNTIDELVVKRLSSKQEIGEKILFDFAKDMRNNSLA